MNDIVHKVPSSKEGLRGNRKAAWLLVTISILALIAAALPVVGEASAARPKACFGKKINRVIQGSNRTVRLDYGDVAWIKGDRVTAIGKPNGVICADRGRQTVRPGKGRTLTSTGANNDRIILAKSSRDNVVHTGLGNDYVAGANGRDFIYASPRRNRRNLSDRDIIYGLGGNDRIFDYLGDGNQLFGGDGTDRIISLGTAVSDIHCGGGSDTAVSNGGLTSTGRVERLFGERGNDLLKASELPSNGPVFLDGGPGDDRLVGTRLADTAITNSGVKRIATGRGDDLIVANSRGIADIDGGFGNDTISYATHVPPGYRTWDGVMVDLTFGRSIGFREYKLRKIENVIGSPFDDRLFGKRDSANTINGGLGDDCIQDRNRGTLRNDCDATGGTISTEDQIDGGMGQNQCYGFGKVDNCNRDSPGRATGHQSMVDINEGGVLTVVGSNFADTISVGYDFATGSYDVRLNTPGVASGLCTALRSGGKLASCRANINNLNGIIIYGGDGNDRITIEESVPAPVTTSISGGSGKSTLIGGKTKDFIQTNVRTSAGSVLMGRGNTDLLVVHDRVRANGGDDPDVLKVPDVCIGAQISGGTGSDNLVMVGNSRGVNANLQRGTAFKIGGSCRSPVKIARDIEGLEGSERNDKLTLGKKFSSQRSGRSLLGREGRDVLNSRNGTRDTVTTGSGGRSNRVISDSKDKIIWGWGLSGAR